MKIVIAITALTGLIAVGCAHRDKDNDSHQGGSYDESSSTTSSGKDMKQDYSTWGSSTNSSTILYQTGSSHNSDDTKSNDPQK